VFRKNADGSQAQGPNRAIGVLHFTVQRERHQLTARLQDTPYQIPPGSSVPIQISAEDSAGKKLEGKAMVAVYIVDEGLLNLTGHPLPQPYQHFYGRRRLAFEIHDSYTRLLLRREGGDTSRLVTRLQYSNYLSDTIIAHAELRAATFVGGVASFDVRVPQLEKFTGSLRVAAVVWTAEAMGVADKDIVVRDALVANLGLPRFLTPGDRPVLPLMLENIEALDDEYRITVSGLGIDRVTLPGRTASEEVRDEHRVRLAPGERKQMLLHFNGEQRFTGSSPEVSVRIAGSDSRNPIMFARNWPIKMRQPFMPVVTQLKQEQLLPAGSFNLVPSEQTQLRLPSVQARFSAPGFPVPVALSDASLADQAQQLDRLAWTALALLYQQRQGQRPEMLDRTLADIVALQYQSGGFLPYKLAISTTDREAERKVFSAESGTRDEGVELDLWRAALATDVLRLAGAGAGRAYDREIKTAAEFLRREAGWRRTAVTGDETQGDGASDAARLVTAQPARVSESDLESQRKSPGSLRAGFADVPDEIARRLSLPRNNGALVVFVRPGPASAAGLRKGDVILAVNDREVYSANSLTYSLGESGAGAEVKLKVNRNGQVGELTTRLAAPETRALPCSADVAYAAYVLVRLGTIELVELKQFADACMPSTTQPVAQRTAIAKLILAAALTEFGKPDLAQPLLASFNAALAAELAGVPGVDRLEHLGRLLTFLDRLPIARPQMAEVLRTIDGLLRGRNPISLAASGWFARAALERATQTLVAVQLDPDRLERGSIVQVISPHEVATRFIDVGELSTRRVEATNKGGSPVSATLFISGWPATASAPDARLEVKRRYFRPDGSELTDRDLKVAHNDLLFVVVEGRRRTSPADTADPDDGGPRRPAVDELLIIDLLPAGFEIVQPDAFNRRGATQGALPARRGTLRHVEMRDDRYIAIVEADKDRDGQFRTAYAVRATTSGQFRLPQVRVEDMRQPELAADVMEERVVTIEQR
jgi:uncharacterized protein YfaS (alpha-2-macroglobulin family)